MCANPDSKDEFEFPTSVMINRMLASGFLHTLVGFENSEEDGSGCSFNFILSNGARSEQRDENAQTNHTHMIPVSALHKIRRVTIHYLNCISGFSFFDKDGAWIWEVGCIEYWGGMETVELAENEVIAGVKAKLHPDYPQSVYTDFSFLIAT